MNADTTYLIPDEPQRFTNDHAEHLLAYCHSIGASDITIQTNHPVFAEIFGKLFKVTRRELSNTEVGDILNSIYGANGTAQILSGQDVDTYFEVRPSRSERYRYRVNGTGCQVEGHHGIQITLRTIPSEPPKLSTMALPDDLQAAMAPAEGVIYVTGATGSGKSTLLSAIIRDLAEQEDGHRKMLTYEAPIEFVYDAVKMPSSIISQSEIPRHIPNFAMGVRNALRRKPRLILVGEARDHETMSAVLEAAMTGHPVYTTLHSNGVAETMRRLVTTFPKEERNGRTVDILETVRAIIWQKLVTSTDGKRVALREYLIFNEKIRDQLLDMDLEEVTMNTRKMLRQHGQTMAQDAKAKFDAGLIDERTYKLLIAATKHADKDATIQLDN